MNKGLLSLLLFFTITTQASGLRRSPTNGNLGRLATAHALKPAVVKKPALRALLKNYCADIKCIRKYSQILDNGVYSKEVLDLGDSILVEHRAEVPKYFQSKDKVISAAREDLLRSIDELRRKISSKINPTVRIDMSDCEDDSDSE